MNNQRSSLNWKLIWKKVLGVSLVKKKLLQVYLISGTQSEIVRRVWRYQRGNQNPYI